MFRSKLPLKQNRDRDRESFTSSTRVKTVPELIPDIFEDVSS